MTNDNDVLLSVDRFFADGSRSTAELRHTPDGLVVSVDGRTRMSSATSVHDAIKRHRRLHDVDREPQR